MRFLPVTYLLCILMLIEVAYSTPCLSECPQPCDDSSACAQVQHGDRRPLVDGMGWVIGIPRKILLWDRRADNHHVSETTVAEISEYLDCRGLDDTVVRVNQYAPIDEWNRLVKNDRMASGWKYTVGSLKWLQYTVLPGRVFGHDEYNPYSNSLYLYSDMPTLGLAESAFAKDVYNRNRPGTYAVAQELPLVAMWHETLATEEVVSYVEVHGSSEPMDKVRQDLYSRYGLEAAGTLSRVVPDGTGLYSAVGAVAGHSAAAVENRQYP